MASNICVFGDLRTPNKLEPYKDMITTTTPFTLAVVGAEVIDEVRRVAFLPQAV